MRFSWTVVPAAAVALFASAAPAHAAKVESLQKLGRESYFAFVEQKVPREGGAEGQREDGRQAHHQDR